MKHVIIGAGPAGVTAAETLRALSPESDILIIGDEPEAPYSRMAIPYHLIGQIGEAGTYLRKGADHYDQQRIELLQQRVNAVDPVTKTLSLDNGNSQSYDKLLLATGSRATRPPIPGMDMPSVYNCWTLNDARKIIDETKPDSRVVLMGAGFIGCIILEALVARGVKLTVVEMENRMVPRMMNELSGGLLKQWCVDKGVTVLTEARVTGIEKGSEHALSVQMEVGGALPADVVICATGVKPNIDMLNNSKIDLDDGILVNERLQSSQPDIYAAGDVAQGKDFSTGMYSVQAIQPTAVDHGRIAASNMANGHEVIHQGSVNMNVLDTIGLISSSFGQWQGVDNGDTSELSDPDNYRYINLQFEDDVIVGANSLGVTEHIGILRGLIQSRIRLGKWKQRLMDDPTRIMEAWLGSTQSL